MSNTKNFYVYKITNHVNGKIYIGKSRHSAKTSRWKKHLDVAQRNKPNESSFSYLHRCINAHGKDNFVFEILDSFENESDAYDKESELISHFKSNNSEFGMNLNSGGRRAFTQAESTKKLIAKKRMGFKFTQNSLKKMSDSHKGKISHCIVTDQECIDIINLYYRDRLSKLENENTNIDLIAKRYSVTKHTISSILFGSRFEKYKKLCTFPQLPDGYLACSICKTILPCSKFYKSKTTKTGFQGRCKDCDLICKHKSTKKLNA